MRRKVKTSAAQLDFFSRLAQTPADAPLAPVVALHARPPVRRVFLGFERPALHAVADHLLARADEGPVADLGHVLVTVPGARAGRRLLELLVERAADGGRALVPPRMLTTGALTDVLAGAEDEAAPPIVRALAWGLALRDAPGLAARLVAHPPDAADLPAWAARGAELDTLASELGKAALGFADVLKRVRGVPGVPLEDLRWEALAELEPHASSRLVALGARDVHAARRAALASPAARLPAAAEVVLACVADVPLVLRALLAPLGARVTALVQAEETDAARFDALGAVVPAAWTSARIAIDDAKLFVCDGPAAQAARVVDALAALGARSLEDVAVGVPDAEVTPQLVARLEDAGARGRDAAGVPVSRTAPYALLAAAAALAERDGFRELAALVRHPHLDAWLRDALHAEAHEDLAGVLDAHHEVHLPARIGDGPVGSDRAARRTRAIVDGVRRWLGELGHGQTRPLRAWARPIVALLSRTYGDLELSRDEDDDRLVLESLAALRDATARLDALREDVPATAPQALSLVLTDVADREAHEAAGEAAVELLGWLDLAIDDAPVSIVTGLVEGRLPGSVTAHPFLPDALRTALGLDDDATRHARDAHALTALLRSHADVTLITARTDADGNPLAPSRLLLSDDDDVIAARVRRFYESAGAPPPPPPLRALAPGRTGASDLRIAPPTPPAAPVDTLHVTAFRDYLACPYRFYLKHVEKLSVHDDADLELDPGGFGVLAHEVLHRFGESAVRDAEDAREIDAFVQGALRDVAAERFGGVAHPAVRLQLAQLGSRLRDFARVQAARACDGFRIVRTEVSATAAFEVDGVPLTLRGRIDRIDRRDGELWVIDYKLPERLKTPKELHLASDQWVDLQLPLYRYLAGPMAEGARIVPAFFSLPRHGPEAEVLPATWDDEAHEAALEVAREVVRGVRTGRFWPPSPPKRHRFEEYAVLLQESQLGVRTLDADEKRDAECEG